MSPGADEDTRQPLLRGTPNFIWSANDLLGQGATGAVFRGRHKRTGDLVAIKTFNAASQLRPLEQHKREFEVLRKLSHENIVRLITIENESQNGTEVLLMELCTHGSLYNLLDQPENAHGLAEEEMRIVLRDVAAGMEHLRENGVVHRDIKPGNIMKYEDHETGRYIYKLIDFGAARELEDDDHFMSLYGTEEYLHPDLYQRAVLRRPTSKRLFGVGVDLWSLGVTLYHAATGTLPFRPFGGRKNREVMFRITTEKASGVISGIQESEGGRILWKRDLPDTCQLSRGFRALLTPILAGLMECDTQRMYNFAEYFAAVARIQTKRVLHVFNIAAATVMHVYLDNAETMMDFQEHVKMQTQILPADQQLLYGNATLVPHWVNTTTPGSEYPTTSATHPIYLFCPPSKVPPNSSNLVEPQLPKYPDIVVTLNSETDVPLAKTCAGIVALVKLRMEETVAVQRLLIEAAIMYSMQFQLEVKQSQPFTTNLFQRVEETGKRVDLFGYTNKTQISLLRMHGHRAGLAESLANIEKLDSTVPDIFQSVIMNTEDIRSRLQDYLQRQIEDRERDTRWKWEKGCSEPEKCINKVDYLCRVTKRTVDDFRRDRSMKSLSYNEEQIHKFEKSKLVVNGTKALSILQGHCFPNTQKLFYKFKTWFRELCLLKEEFSAVQESINNVLQIHLTVTKALDRDLQRQRENINGAMAQLGTAASSSSSSSTAARPSSASAPASSSASASTSASTMLSSKIQYSFDSTMANLPSLRYPSMTSSMVVMEEEGQKYTGFSDREDTMEFAMSVDEQEHSGAAAAAATTETTITAAARAANVSMVKSLFQKIHELEKTSKTLRGLVIDTDQELKMLDQLQDQGGTLVNS